MAPTNTLEDDARDLMGSLTGGLDHPLGIGSFSAAIYDTAWVAMVEKVDEGTGDKHALFPECFQFLLDNQLSDGTWEAYSCDLDGIMNSMAALLALKRRSTSLKTPDAELNARCVRAEDALQQLMKSWDVGSCDRVGFEIIVPALLRLLQDLGVEIEFPARDALMRLCDAKTAKLYPLLYGGTQSTLTHSLEAFAGKLSYDKVKHHASPYGAMLASPSSTAASLIYSNKWDHRAEQYLQQVVDVRGRKEASQALFQLLSSNSPGYVTTTLLDAGFTQGQLGNASISKVAEIMSDNLAQQDGIVGFAPYCLPDADDTALAISVLGFVGKHLPLDSLCAQYETPSHFLTYRGERNASFSANCNILLCLLRRPDVFDHTSRVVKCTQFLSKLWYEGKVKDKWNTSDHYPMMLLAKAFVMLLSRWEKGDFNEQDLPIGLVSERVPIVLMDILIRTLDRQSSNGSWDSLNEVTAYALITLATLSRVPWFQSIDTEVTHAIKQAREFLGKNRDSWSHAEYLWIEKVAYSSSNLSTTYCLAAMKATESRSQTEILGNKVSNLIQTPPKMSKTMAKFFSRIPMFVKMPLWKLEVSVTQALQFVPALGRIRLDIFPRKSVGKDKYLQYIPFTWISIGNGSVDLSLDAQWEMMILSMLIYQVDEFIEAFVAHELNENLDNVRNIVRRHCSSLPVEPSKKRPAEDTLDDHAPAPKLRNGMSVHPNSSNPVNESMATNGNTNSHTTTNRISTSNVATNGNHNCSSSSSASLIEADQVLGHFIKHIRTHPKVSQSPDWLQHWQCREIEAFLLAHLTHIADCHSLASQPSSSGEPLVFKSAHSTYFDWVRTTTADTTGGPFAFPFYMCLLDTPTKDKMSDIVVRYIAQDASRHLATLCRQHNDVGSLARDRLEKNLNSVNFVEFNFNTTSTASAGLGNWDGKLKTELLKVAEYERACLDKALLDLEKLVDPKLGNLVRVFVNVTDLYGQLYQAKDISASNLNR